MNSQKFDWFPVLLVVWVAMITIQLYVSDRNMRALTRECQAAGGLPVRTETGVLCLSPDAVKDVGE